MFDTAIRPLEKPPDAETETAQSILKTRDHRTARDHNYATNNARKQTANTQQTQTATHTNPSLEPLNPRQRAQIGATESL
jgi:hypothetical protein